MHDQFKQPHTYIDDYLGTLIQIFIQTCIIIKSRVQPSLVTSTGLWQVTFSNVRRPPATGPGRHQMPSYISDYFNQVTNRSLLAVFGFRISTVLMDKKSMLRVINLHVDLQASGPPDLNLGSVPAHSDIVGNNPFLNM